jgi:hypothetical protein
MKFSEQLRKDHEGEFGRTLAEYAEQVAALKMALAFARARLADMLMGDDGQARKEAERAIPMIDEALAKARGEDR